MTALILNFVLPKSAEDRADEAEQARIRAGFCRRCAPTESRTSRGISRRGRPCCILFIFVNYFSDVCFMVQMLFIL